MAKKRKGGKKKRSNKLRGTRKPNIGDELIQTGVASIGGFGGAVLMEAADKFGGSITAKSNKIAPSAVIAVGAGLRIMWPDARSAADGMAGAGAAALAATMLPNGVFGNSGGGGTSTGTTSGVQHAPATGHPAARPQGIRAASAM